MPDWLMGPSSASTSARAWPGGSFMLQLARRHHARWERWRQREDEQIARWSRCRAVLGLHGMAQRIQRADWPPGAWTTTPTLFLLTRAS